jgi:hypothetical protein
MTKASGFKSIESQAMAALAMKRIEAQPPSIA